MANASKAPPKPSKLGAQAKGPGPARAATASSTTTTASNPTARGLRLALGILVLAVLTGVIPVALAGQALGYWASPLTPPTLPFLPGALSYEPTLATPQPLITSATVNVSATPGGATIAIMEAGFPVTVHQYASDGGARWAGFSWSGPTATTGGRGWAPASQLRAPGATPARPVGSLAAFSPALAASATAGGPGFAAWVYFPDKGGYTYHTANATHAMTLGEQIVPVVLVADYGLGLAALQPSSMTQNLASRDPTALRIIFISLNRAGSLNAYLARYHLTGFHVTNDATPSTQQILDSTASVQDLGLFYDAMASEQMVSSSDQSQVFALLTGANANATSYAPANEIGSGALVVTTTQDSTGYTTTVAGRLQPDGGQSVVVAVSSGPQPTAAQSQTVAQSFFHTLITALG